VSELVDAAPRYAIVKAKVERGTLNAEQGLEAVYAALRSRFPEASVDTQDGLRLAWRDAGCTCGRRIPSRSSGSSPRRRPAPRPSSSWTKGGDYVRHRRVHGPRQAAVLMLEGLRRLEYRGYDSAGLALIEDGRIEVHKAAGKISVLEKALGAKLPAGHTGIAHTRWARTARPHRERPPAHRLWRYAGAGPQRHHRERRRAAHRAREARSRVPVRDRYEVLAHLIEELLPGAGSLVEAVAGALHQVEGTYGIAWCRRASPIRSSRRGAARPARGHRLGENFVASDASAVLAHTRRWCTWTMGEIAVVRPQDYRILDLDTVEKERRSPGWIGPRHHRARRTRALHAQEIMEQPRACGTRCAGGCSRKTARPG